MHDGPVLRFVKSFQVVLVVQVGADQVGEILLQNEGSGFFHALTIITGKRKQVHLQDEAHRFQVLVDIGIVMVKVIPLRMGQHGFISLLQDGSGDAFNVHRGC